MNEPTPKAEGREKMDRDLEKVSGWYERERSIQAPNRIERAIDEDFEDGDQYTAEDRAELEDRGQAAIVFNEIKPTIEWLLGTEKRSRADWKIVPRAEDDVKPSLRKTKLFKYVSDLNAADYQRSLAFGCAVRSGDGWLKVATKLDEQGKPQVVYEHASWREFWPDSRCRKADMSDARYLHRARYVDLDDAIAMFPKHAEALRSAASSDTAAMSDDMDGALESEFEESGFHRDGSERLLVRLVESWYREPARVRVLRGEGPLDGTEYQPSPEIDLAIAGGLYEVVNVVKQRVRMMVWVTGCVLHSGDSPYKHGLFPYVRIVAYRKKRNGAVYGVVRGLRDPQEDLNKRRSKALYAMSVRRVLMEKGAVEDMDALAEEVSRPDSIIEYAAGRKLEIVENGQIAAGHLQLAQEDSAYIRLASGVTGENLGLQTNATSGKAIEARQEQGAVVTTTLFDNLRQGNIISGKMVLSMIEQFMTEQMTFRITGERGKDEFVTINNGEPENDITRQMADFTVDEQDWKASTRQAMAEEMIRIAGTLPPDIALLMIDIAIDMMDFQQKGEVVKRIRKAGGLSNPDATDEEQVAEQQRDAQRQEAQAAAAKAQQREADARAALSEANAELASAKAQREHVAILSDKLKTLREAIESAAAATLDPGLAATADDVLAQLDALLAPGQGLPDQSQTSTMTPNSNPPPMGQQVAGA